MDAETAKKLRAPFPVEVVGKLPRVWCGKCRDANKSRRPACDDHHRAKCQVCGNNITNAHLHLDYVGHAAITDRLLQVDTGWSWEPVAFGQDGLPVLDNSGGLWIRLTVAGVTRLGYGDAEGKTGPAAVKEAIGDALRNGAMRFGVGLDLWHKDGPLPQEDEPASTAPTDADLAKHALARLAAVCNENGWDRPTVAARWAAEHAVPLGEAMDAGQIDAFRQGLFDVSDSELKVSATNGAQA